MIRLSGSQVSTTSTTWDAGEHVVQRAAALQVLAPGSRAAGLAMAFKLIEAAQDRWRAVNAPHLVALVRVGATFEAGKLVERPDDNHQPEAA
jgi:hypothetical protein